MTQATGYRHIVLDEGCPRIQGSRMKVIQLATAHVHHGWSVAELIWQFPGHSLSEIHSALAYYFDHKQELDRQAEADDAWIEQLQESGTADAPTRDELKARSAG